MDGRRNLKTFEGSTLAVARPKVVGGPTLFLNNVLSIGGKFSANTPMIERFRQCAQLFPGAASMHEGCGMAGLGSTPVLKNYLKHFDEIQNYTAALTGGHMKATDEQKQRIAAGIQETIGIAEQQLTNYNEAEMIRIVREISGDNAVIQLAVDHDAPNHSHTEKGMVYLFSSDNLVMIKDRVVDNPDLPDVFYHNAGYGKKLIKAAVGLFDTESLELLQLIGMQLPLAANITLGKNQWLGSIGDYDKMSAHLYAA